MLPFFKKAERWTGPEANSTYGTSGRHSIMPNPIIYKVINRFRQWLDRYFTDIWQRLDCMSKHCPTTHWQGAPISGCWCRHWCITKSGDPNRKCEQWEFRGRGVLAPDSFVTWERQEAWHLQGAYSIELNTLISYSVNKLLIEFTAVFIQFFAMFCYGCLLKVVRACLGSR